MARERPHHATQAKAAALAGRSRVLWRAARFLMRGLMSALGAPEEIAQRGLLTRRARAEILAWLRPVEALLRRLLLVRAAALAPELAPPCAQRAAKKRERARQLVAQDLLHAADWRVRFRMLSAFPAASPDKTYNESVYAAVWSRVAAGESLYLVLKSLNPEERARYGADCARPKTIAGDPWPLAERAEAVLRVLADPTPFARRLAQRLTAQPGRVRALGASYERSARACAAEASGGLDPPFSLNDRLFVEAQAAAIAAVDAFDTS